MRRSLRRSSPPPRPLALRPLAGLLLAGPFVAAAACKSLPPALDADLKHDTGAAAPFVARADLELREGPYYWRPTDKSEFIASALTPSSHFKMARALFDEADPTVQVLQRYLDAAHAYVMTKPGFVGRTDVPKPRVMISPDLERNAYVTGVPVCLDTAMVAPFAAPTAADGDLATLSFGELRALGFNPFTGAVGGCVDAPWSKDVHAFAEWFNAVQGPCRVKETPAGLEVENADGCEARFVKSAKRLAFVAQTNVIYLSSKMAETFKDPEELAAIVLHEASHFYRAHAITAEISPLYGYFYDETVAAPARKPPPRADSRKLIADASRFTSNPARPIARTQLEARARNLYLSVIGGVVGHRCTGPTCPKACAKAETWASSPWVSELAFGSLTPAASKSYKTAEPALIACAKQLRIVKDGGPTAPAAAEVTQGEILAQAAGLGYPVINDLALGERPLYDALVDFGKLSAQRDADTAAFYGDLAKTRTAYYTFEQEADELSLEIMSELGIAPRKAADAGADFAAVVYPAPADFERVEGMKWTAFQAAFKDEWRGYIAGTAAGGAIPPLGTLSNPHHSQSFRSFNIFREIDAHAYASAAPKVTPPTAAEWKAFLAAAKKLSDIASGPEPMFTPGAPPPGPLPASVLGAERQALLRRHVLQLQSAAGIDPDRPD
jgi:Zn-dependent protease with chaperone function